MRFPHRVRINDPRNRQPPKGVAYDAAKYDILLLDFNPDFQEDDVAILNANNKEPENVKAVFYDVPALVTTSDDGTRNLASTTYAVRIPAKAFFDARTYLEAERERSLDSFGYETNAALLQTAITLTPNGFEPVAAGSLNSSYLEPKLRTRTLSLDPVPNFVNPFTDRIVPGGLAWFYNRATIRASGVFPPIKSWENDITEKQRRDTVRDTQYENINRYPINGVYAELVRLYPFGLQVTRIDAYSDIVEIRCIETLNYL